MRLVPLTRPALLASVLTCPLACLLACLLTCLQAAVLPVPAAARPAGASLVGGAAPGADLAPGRGWVWPLQPQPGVVTPFDEPDGPYAPGHRGVDLAGAVGQPVLAVAAGEVSFAGPVAGRGVVVVDHGRLRTTYEPVVPLMGPGEVVTAGQAVGTLAVFGSHCLPAACLHLGVRDGDDYLDPLDFLTTGPVRLLPLSSRRARTVPASLPPFVAPLMTALVPPPVPLFMPLLR